MSKQSEVEKLNAEIERLKKELNNGLNEERRVPAAREKRNPIW
jgi:hypothetical protein